MARVHVRDDLGSYELNTAGPTDHLHRVMAKSGKPYEHRLLGILQQLIRPGDLVVDVGANIGNHSIAFARHGALVEAVEANPEALALLAINIACNGTNDAISVHPVGLSDSSGWANARAILRDNLGSVALEREASGSIELVTFDSLGVKGAVRLLKVDVEGAELPVLRGCRSMLDRDRPLVVVELHGHEQRHEARRFLCAFGYHMLPWGLATSPTFLFWSDSKDLLRILGKRELWIQLGWRAGSLARRRLR